MADDYDEDMMAEGKVSPETAARLGLTPRDLPPSVRIHPDHGGEQARQPLVSEATIQKVKEGVLTIDNPKEATLAVLGGAGFGASAHPGADAEPSEAWSGAGGLTPETEAVWAEYSRAKAKHGDYVIDGPVYSDAERYVVMMEEVGEAAHELTYDVDGDERDERLYAELIQVATMALGFAKAVRERGRL